MHVPLVPWYLWSSLGKLSPFLPFASLQVTLLLPERCGVGHTSRLYIGVCEEAQISKACLYHAWLYALN